MRLQVEWLRDRNNLRTLSPMTYEKSPLIFRLRLQYYVQLEGRFQHVVFARNDSSDTRVVTTKERRDLFHTYRKKERIELNKSKALEYAEFIDRHPHLTRNQVAEHFGVSRIWLYRMLNI